MNERYDELIEEIFEIGRELCSLNKRFDGSTQLKYLPRLINWRGKTISREADLDTEELERLFYLGEFVNGIYNDLQHKAGLGIAEEYTPEEKNLFQKYMGM